MGNSIFIYVEQLEMLAFFSGYPLVYYLVRILTRNTSYKNIRGAELVSILPFAYALIGTLYLGLQLKNLYPDYSIENVRHRIQQPYLYIWALLSLLFWISFIAQRKILSVLHSLVFFFIIVKDLFFRLTGLIVDRDILKNDMKVYSVSVVLNLAAFILLALLIFLISFRKKYLKSWSFDIWNFQVLFRFYFAIPISLTLVTCPYDNYQEQRWNLRISLR